MKVGTRSMKVVNLPDPAQAWAIHEQATLCGKVLRIGGERGRIRMQFDFDGTQDCDAGVELAEKIAPLLYKRVELSGVVRRNIRSMDFLGMKVESFALPIPKREAADIFRELDEMFGDRYQNFDVIGAIRAGRR